MKPLKHRVTTITLVPEGEPIFHENGYTVSIDDEAAGEFIVVRENAAEREDGLRMNPEDWAALRNAIDRMVNQVKYWAADEENDK